MTNTYTLDQLDSFPWIVSTDTLKTEHLLLKYWEALEQVHRCRYVGHPFAAEQRTLTQQLEQLAGPDAKECDWDEDEAASYVDKMAELLNDYAPTGFYFGSHEGDGACFGFWLEQDWADVLSQCCVPATLDSADWAQLIGELAELGYDPDNLRDCYSGQAEGYTEAEAGADAAAMIAEELVYSAQKQAEAGWPFRHIDWEAAWEELQLSDNYQVVQWSHARWLVLSGC
jgi:hypothetical protein